MVVGLKVETTMHVIIINALITIVHSLIAIVGRLSISMDIVRDMPLLLPLVLPSNVAITPLIQIIILVRAIGGGLHRALRLVLKLIGDRAARSRALVLPRPRHPLPILPQKHAA